MAMVLDVAMYFISRSTPFSRESVTNLKLQKLLYYAQGFHLAIHGRVLFDDEIEAWVHGPVIPCVYHEFKHHSYHDIDEKFHKEDYILTPNETLLLEDVWEIFKLHSGKDLEKMTHDEEPWIEARRGLSEYSYSDNQIDQDTLRDYFIAEYLE
ncbi:Panacea domain-containing protein [Bacillus sp. SCS-151]|uniref:Panacea domain-containing protein n=1 Tax=Nanhaiella sioensis TaxID=3115293 RepID=UPI00397ABEC5